MIRRVLLLALCVLFSLSAAAQLPRNEVSISAGWTEFASLGGARAIGASYGHFWTPAVSTQLGAIFAGDQVIETHGGNSFTDVHALAQVHALRDHLLSPWIGFGVALVSIDYSERSDSKFTTIAGGGVDVKISPRLAIGAELDYSPYELDPGERFAVNLNPATVSVAARWRY